MPFWAPPPYPAARLLHAQVNYVHPGHARARPVRDERDCRRYGLILTCAALSLGPGLHASETGAPTYQFWKSPLRLIFTEEMNGDCQFASCSYRHPLSISRGSTLVALYA